jgi:hypothetical protein
MLTRRALLAGLAAAAAACREEQNDRAADTLGTSPPASSAMPPPPPATSTPAPAPRGPERVVTGSLQFGTADGGPQQAALVVPQWGMEGERFPLLVALSGLGESRKGIDAGSWGWVKDYWLDRAMKRLRSPPLTRADFQKVVAAERLAAINASLAARPFRGLVVACPFTPDLIAKRSLDNAGPFADFVARHLVPRVRAEAPVIDTRGATGIDGVSLGGRVSLLAALERPETFAAVGIMQGAFEPDEVDDLARRTSAALQRGAFRLRLLTSAGDFYRGVTERLHTALSRAGVAHDHATIAGPHDYVFNRGPGAIEMLLWHDRVLRGEAPDP